MDNQQEIINNFFTKNYKILLQKCQDYCRVYNYRLLESPEILSELYLFTIQDSKRTNKLSELIMLSAITLNKMYKYSSLAHYYISRILFDTIRGHRDFSNNNNKPNQKKTIKLLYVGEIFDELPEEIYEETREYTVEDIYQTAERLGVGENWWQYEIWKKKYVDQMTYKQISEYFRLNTTPCFNATKSYNELIRQEIQKNSRKLENCL